MVSKYFKERTWKMHIENEIKETNELTEFSANNHSYGNTEITF